MSKLNQNGAKTGSLATEQTERALFQLAAMLAVLAGLIDTVGILAFGNVFLSSPTANATVLGANLPTSSTVALFAGAILLSFVAGVTITTLMTQSAKRFRRSLVLLVVTVGLFTAYVTFYADVPLVPAVLLAMAVGSAHCIFEANDRKLQEAMSPTTQLVRFGEAVADRQYRLGDQKTGMHIWFWIAFLFGGVAGVIIWMALGSASFAFIACVTGILSFRMWRFEFRISKV